jgi:hypothetical protein
VTPRSLSEVFALTFVWLFCSPLARGYSVLSHEAIIDAAWEKSLKPLLLQRYPGASGDELKTAHAYAYGGAIIQDMGYYPFGSHFFSDLTHYVRSGDFILNEISGAQDINEYAFALGSVAHYAADNVGHPQAINLAVPMLYPKLRRKFGRVATYEDGPSAHIKTEFSFDVVEVAEHRYAPDGYHDLIGFEVSKPLLERAFLKTYGFPIRENFLSLDLALGTYRFSVSKAIPEMTKVAWQINQKELMQAIPGVTKQKFVYRLSRSSYEKEWGAKYEKPGFWSRFLACLLKLIPRFGPFKTLGFKVPTPAAQKLFLDSFAATSKWYGEELAAVQAGKLPPLANRNFDTGMPVKFGDYKRADEAGAKLLIKLSEHKFDQVDADLRKSLLDYYGNNRPADPKALAALEGLRLLPDKPAGAI